MPAISRNFSRAWHLESGVTPPPRTWNIATETALLFVTVLPPYPSKSGLFNGIKLQRNWEVVNVYATSRADSPPVFT